MIFKEMEYTKDRLDSPVLLAEGRHLGYHWVILSFGTHPCAYVQITNEEHPYYLKQYDNEKVDISVHGGLTYSRRYLKIPDEDGKIAQYNGGWWLGWDYAHGGDYIGYYDNNEVFKNEKRWTTNAILEDVYSVIYQLATAINWSDIFDRWSKPGDYERDKAKGIIKIEDNKNDST